MRSYTGACTKMGGQEGQEGQEGLFRYLGDLSAVYGYGTGLSCHHCRVYWTG